MCGILGGVKRGGAFDRTLITSALSRLAHRGPDAEGIYENAPVFLGHRRLSVIDLDPRANQPMKVGRHVIVLNGEIYNYRAVRADLERLGLSFRTRSDTEVVAAAFAHEGLRCLDRFEGMFAFAIWDEEKKTLTLARDRFGEKPLAFYHDRNQFLFASEIPALKTLLPDAAVDDDAIRLYFQFSYIPAPYAPYRDMRQLEPGSWLEFDANDRSLKTGKYYEPKPQPRSISKKEAVAELRRRLADSVKLRLSAADVPVATFLSGGIDSSIVATLAAEHSDHVRAYSIGFPQDPDFDESPYARLVAARHPRLRHTVIDATEPALLEFTDRTLSKLGEPYADASLIPTAYLCSQVEEKVILGGDGADEIFAGYGVYAAMRMPNWLKRAAQLFPAPKNPHAIVFPPLRALALFRSHLAATPGEEYLSWRSYASPSQLQALGVGNAPAIPGNPDFKTLSGLLAFDIGFNLPNDMLKKVDLASMQHGLEVRAPYLDRGLVEFALSLPEDLLIHGRERKYILREAFRDLLPPAVLTRRKQGFLLPIRRWFASGALKEQLLDLAGGSHALNPAAIKTLTEEHACGQRDHSMLLWMCYVYLKWRAQ